MIDFLLCLLGAGLALLGAMLLVRPERFEKMGQLAAAAGGGVAKRYGTLLRLLGIGCLMAGTVLFMVMLARTIVDLTF